MAYIIKLEVGDSSYDGHGMTEDFYIESSQPYAQVEKMHKQGCKKLKIKFENFFNSYLETELPKKEFDILKKAGLQDFMKKHGKDFEPYLYEEYLEENNEDLISANDGLLLGGAPGIYTLIWIFIAMQGDFNKGEQTEWEWKPHTPDYETIQIGGYGLFSN